jgi:hypothetical protein
VPAACSATEPNVIQRGVWSILRRAGWMAATLDGMVEATGAVFEAKFMLPWSFSEEGAAAKHMAQLQLSRRLGQPSARLLCYLSGCVPLPGFLKAAFSHLGSIRVRTTD